jgi:hypothetical protein
MAIDIWVTDCSACGRSHRIGHCVMDRREAQRAAWADRMSRPGEREREQARQRALPRRAGRSRVTGVTVTAELPCGMPTPVYTRCPDCQRMHAAGDCRMGRAGAGEVARGGVPAPAVQRPAPAAPAPAPAPARLELSAGLTAVVMRQAGGGDPLAWLERAVLAYVAGGGRQAEPAAAAAEPGKRRAMTPAEKMRAWRARERAKRAQGSTGDAE